jgi:hypothetical protein
MNAALPKNYAIPACLCLIICFGASAQNAPASPRTINVSTVRELYAAVNNSANRGATVRLAPGTYVLSTYYPGGALRPNRGSLRMPPGMSLVGSERRIDRNGDGVPDAISDDTPDRFTVPGTETVIDGSGLDLPFEERADCAGKTFNAPNPVIHVGVANTVSHLSLVAGNHVGIGEPTNDPVDPSGNLSMTVRYVVLDALAGMSFANCECAARRARSVLLFSHNVVRGAIAFGVLIQNFLTGDAGNDHADGPAIWAMLTSNLFYNDSTALQAAGGERGTDGGSVTLYMNGNLFLNNGTNFRGHGSAATAVPGMIGNRLALRSEFDTFGEANSNVTLTAGTGTGETDPIDSELEAEFLHSHFIRDSAATPAEISIVGGDGRHNRARVLIRYATVKSSAGDRTRGGLSIQNQSVPGIGTSTAKLEGSRQEFLLRNQGLPAPPARFFLVH